MASTYSQLRGKLAEVWNRVEETKVPEIITRRGHQDMAIIPAEELEGLRETAHLFRSPENARRLLAALSRALNGESVETSPAALRARHQLDE